jgi:hypothetical protein
MICPKVKKRFSPFLADPMTIYNFADIPPDDEEEDDDQFDENPTLVFGGEDEPSEGGIALVERQPTFTNYSNLKPKSFDTIEQIPLGQSHDGPISLSTLARQPAPSLDAITAPPGGGIPSVSTLMLCSQRYQPVWQQLGYDPNRGRGDQRHVIVHNKGGGPVELPPLPANITVKTAAPANSDFVFLPQIRTQAVIHRPGGLKRSGSSDALLPASEESEPPPQPEAEPEPAEDTLPMRRFSSEQILETSDFTTEPVEETQWAAVMRGSSFEAVAEEPAEEAGEQSEQAEQAEQARVTAAKQQGRSFLLDDDQDEQEKNVPVRASTLRPSRSASSQKRAPSRASLRGSSRVVVRTRTRPQSAVPKTGPTVPPQVPDESVLDLYEADDDYEPDDDVPPEVVKLIATLSPKSLAYRVACGEEADEYSRDVQLALLSVLRPITKKAVEDGLIGETAYLNWIMDRIKLLLRIGKPPSDFEEKRLQRVEEANQDLADKRQRFSSARGQAESERDVKLQELELLYNQQCEKLGAHWRSEAAYSKFNHPSKPLVEARKLFKMKLLAKQYDEAGILADHVHVLEQREAEVAADHMEAAYKEQADRLLRRFERDQDEVRRQFQMKIVKLDAEEKKEMIPLDRRINKLEAMKRDEPPPPPLPPSRPTTATGNGVSPETRLKLPRLQTPPLPPTRTITPKTPPQRIQFT